MRWLYAIILLVFAHIPAHAISCDMIKSAMQTLSKDRLEQLKAQATPEQIAFGRKCLEGEKPAKSSFIVKKPPKRVKKAHKTSVPKVVPLPRPAPEKIAVPLPPVKEVAPEPVMSEQTVQETHPMQTVKDTVGLLEVFAFIGIIAFTFFAGKWGLMPVIDWIKDRVTAGRDAALAAEKRIADLEKKVEALSVKLDFRQPIPPAAPPAASPPAA